MSLRLAPAAPPPRPASAEFPRLDRGVAASRLRGISTSRPRRRRGPSPRKIPAAPAPPPRPVASGTSARHRSARPQVQTGGTLYECGAALQRLGAARVSAFVAHAVFPREAWRRFCRGGDRAIFDTFYVTNSIPTTTSKLPGDGVFEIIDITDRVIEDLHSF